MPNTEIIFIFALVSVAVRPINHVAKQENRIAIQHCQKTRPSLHIFVFFVNLTGQKTKSLVFVQLLVGHNDIYQHQYNCDEEAESIRHAIPFL